MSAVDVKRAVLKTFSHVNLTHFKYQGINAAHHFETAADQDKDGDTIITVVLRDIFISKKYKR